MRKLIIILAVFVLLFVAVLVWGVARDRDPPEPDEDANCNGLPQKVKIENGAPVIGKDGKPETVVNTDKLEDWMDSCGPKGGGGAANKFAKGVVLKPKVLQVDGGQELDWSVPPGKDDEAPQQVKLTLLSGTLVRVFAPKPSDDAEDDQKLCLCSGQPLMDDVNRECTSDWIADNISSPNKKRGTCGDEAATAKVFFGPGGGDIEIEAVGQSAEVSSAK